VRQLVFEKIHPLKQRHDDGDVRLRDARAEIDHLFDRRCLLVEL